MGLSTPGYVRGKSQNFELNLVPFIDLMSVTAMFLLMTAVWTQVRDMPQTLQFTYDGREVSPLSVLVSLDRIEVWRDYPDRIRIPLLGSGAYDWSAFNDLVRRERAAEPQHELSVLFVDDGVQYQHVIKAFDLMRSAGFLGTAFGAGPGTKFAEEMKRASQIYAPTCQREP